MAHVADMFVPTYQGLSAVDLVRPKRAWAPCFPFSAPDRHAFFRARNAIYHLFRALTARCPNLTVLAPDYNSGNEILAMRAAGARICYYPVDRQLQADPELLDGLCARHEPQLLYVIHYIGWPQPMPALMDVANRHGLLVVEDCALSLLSRDEHRPLGAYGDWAVFCLYKTLALPNGALLTQNSTPLDVLHGLTLRPAGGASVAGRVAELLVQRVRGRAHRVGAALYSMKRALGRTAAALEVRRANVGDIGFNLDEVDLAMSPMSERLLQRIDFDDVRRRRIENYRMLDSLLGSSVVRLFPNLPDGVCPLFFPILVMNKAEAAHRLQQRGVDALEFWNESVEGGAEMGPAARYLRAHVLELPVHQDLTQEQIAWVAREATGFSRGLAA